MREYVDKILRITNDKASVKKVEVHTFDSGAFMIDLWVDELFYCIQLFDNTFGISLVSEQIDLSTMPDVSYDNWDDFADNLEKTLMQIHTISNKLKQSNMTKKDFFVIVVKLFGLYTLIVTLFSVVPTSISYMSIELEGLSTLFSMIAFILLFCTMIIYFLFQSHRVVTFLKLDKGFDDDGIVIGNLTYDKIASLGLIIVGGLIFIDNLPYFLSNAYLAFKSSVDKTLIAESVGYGTIKDYINLWSSLISVLIGYLILTNYTWIVRKIFKDDKINVA